MHSRRLQKLLCSMAAFSIIAMAHFGCAEEAMQEKRTLKVLFVGNSFTYYNGMPTLFQRLVRDSKLPYAVWSRAICKGGQSLIGHLDDGSSDTKIDAWIHGKTEAEVKKLLAQLDKLKKELPQLDWHINNNKKKPEKLKAAKDRKEEQLRKIKSLEVEIETTRNPVWDVVVLQKWGRDRAGEGKSHEAAVSRFVEMIRKRSPNAWILLYQHGYKTEKGATKDLAEHDRIARKFGLGVIPAGMAWLAAKTEKPQAPWLNKDGLHPDALCSYMIACAVYGTIFGTSPEASAYYTYTRQKNDVDLAKFAQKTAWEAVQKHTKNHGKQKPFK